MLWGLEIILYARITVEIVIITLLHSLMKLWEYFRVIRKKLNRSVSNGLKCFVVGLPVDM